MGLLFSKVFSLLWSPKDYKVILVGLHNAGKTTTLYKLILNEVIVTAPTIGSNIEEYQYKNIRFQMWDLGGQEVARATWSTYYTNTNAVIMVVDSTDREHIAVSRDELARMMEHETLKDACLVIFANKQDLRGAMSAAEISTELQLHKLKARDWHIQTSCALTGEGLNEGIDWIASKLMEKKA